MWIFKRVKDIEDFLSKKRIENQIIGFVPTMGALHAGHLTLIAESIKNADVTVCSIFVNPTQFNDRKDLEKYPRTTTADIQALVKAGCNVLFLPDKEDVYPDQSTNYNIFHNDTENISNPTQSNVASISLEGIETLLEGASRPGHFAGVVQVVSRLFDIVKPSAVFFGQKDYQQCIIIKKLIEGSPTFQNIKMSVVPTMRESNGLAMSSRNMRLNDMQKISASSIYHTLLFLKENVKKIAMRDLLQQAEKKLTDAGLKPDYISIAHADTLEPASTWNGHTPLVALIAAFLGEVRLIDNMILSD